MFKKIVIGFCLVIGGLIIQGMLSSKPAQHQPQPQQAITPAAAPAPVAAAPVVDPAKKDARDKFFAKLQANEVFGDIKVRNHVGRVIAGKAFNGLQFKDKQSFASVAAAWCLDNDPKCELLVIHDAGTDKQIGTFSVVQGGLILK